MKLWLLFFLGTIGLFVRKVSKRTDKSTNPSLTYWFKKNWGGFTLSIIFDVAVMIVLTDVSTSVNIQKFLDMLPVGVTVSGKLVLSFIIGYGGGLGAYNVVRKKLGKKGEI